MAGESSADSADSTLGSTFDTATGSDDVSSAGDGEAGGDVFRPPQVNKEATCPSRNRGQARDDDGYLTVTAGAGVATGGFASAGLASPLPLAPD